MVLGMEPQANHLLDKHSILELQPWPGKKPVGIFISYFSVSVITYSDQTKTNKQVKEERIYFGFKFQRRPSPLW